MVLRHLRRPLTLTGPIAAAWRLKLLIRSSRTSQFTTSAPRWQESPEDTPSREKHSLFAELFPEEAKQRARALEQENTNDHRPLGLLGGNPNNVSDPPPSLVSYEDPTYLRPRTLILSAASKHLAESDFYRVGGGPAGTRHLEGWVPGVVRVRAARDPATLEPLGRYHVEFETAAAAEAWRADFRRLWELAQRRDRQHPRGKVQRHRPPLRSVGDRKGYWAGGGGSVGAGFGAGEEEGVRADADVEGFALGQPGMRYDLQVLGESSVGGTAFRAEASIVEKLSQRAGSRFLVLVVVDGGRISVEMLRAAVREDGVRRGLAWRVKNLEGSGTKPGDGGILPFGKSSHQVQEWESDKERERNQAQAQIEDANNSDGSVSNEQDRGDVVVRLQADYRRYPRFILPFLDEAEARRFVRNWHRRQLTLKMNDGRLGAEGWEETRVLNVSYLW